MRGVPFPRPLLSLANVVLAAALEEVVCAFHAYAGGQLLGNCVRAEVGYHGLGERALNLFDSGSAAGGDLVPLAAAMLGLLAIVGLNPVVGHFPVEAGRRSGGCGARLLGGGEGLLGGAEGWRGATAHQDLEGTGDFAGACCGWGGAGMRKGVLSISYYMSHVISM